MTSKSPDSDTGIDWQSSEVAESRNRGRARRGEIQGPATQMMLDLAGFGPAAGSSTLRLVRAIKPSLRLSVLGQQGTCWPPTSLPACFN